MSDGGAPETAGASLRIDRLVIDGVPVDVAQQGGLRAAIERELTRLIDHEGIGAAGGARPALLAPPIQVTAAPAPVELGRQIARSVYEALRSR